MKKTVRIAAVTMNSRVGFVHENMERMARWIESAAERGTDLICFPELTITGYHNQIDIRSVAQVFPGEISHRLETWAKDYHIVILAGMVEDDTDGRLYASHMVVTPEGVIGRYRKIHLAPPEQTIFQGGKEINVFSALDMNFGIQLCYDAHFPELSTRMAEQGADVIFMPHASPRGSAPEKHKSWLRHLPARAFDNSVFVVACNQTGENGKGLTFPGNALVIGPSGKLLAKAICGEEGLLITDLDPSLIDEVRNHKMRYFLPNRKPHITGKKKR